MKLKTEINLPVEIITHFFKLSELVPCLNTLISKKKFEILKEKHNICFLHFNNHLLVDEELDSSYPWLKPLLSFEKIESGVYMISNTLIADSYGKNALQQSICIMDFVEQLFPEIIPSASWTAMRRDCLKKIDEITQSKEIREDEYRQWILFKKNEDLKTFSNFIPSKKWNLLKLKEIESFRSIQVTKLFKPKCTLSALWFVASKHSGVATRHLIMHEITSSFSETYKGFIIPFFSDSRLLLHYDSQLHRINDQNFFYIGCRFAVNVSSLINLLR